MEAAARMEAAVIVIVAAREAVLVAETADAATVTVLADIYKYITHINNSETVCLVSALCGVRYCMYSSRRHLVRRIANSVVCVGTMVWLWSGILTV
jgi:hypothetical protein